LKESLFVFCELVYVTLSLVMIPTNSQKVEDYS